MRPCALFARSHTLAHWVGGRVWRATCVLRAAPAAAIPQCSNPVKSCVLNHVPPLLLSIDVPTTLTCIVLHRDSHSKSLYRALQCFLLDFWDHTECTVGGSEDDAAALRALPASEGISNCFHLTGAGGGRVCMVHVVLATSLVNNTEASTMQTATPWMRVCWPSLEHLESHHQCCSSLLIFTVSADISANTCMCTYAAPGRQWRCASTAAGAFCIALGHFLH
jgi:hypothetical protein